MSAPWLMHAGEVVPDVVVLSHDEQRERLRRECPQALSRAVVAGDPCFDRLVASRPLRESYRQAFGVAKHQRLVVVTSTWGAESLYGSQPALVRQLATRLPVDSHRLVVALHPNIASGHSSWQVRAWLADCSSAGVLVLPREDLWRQALVAADVTIGDHGSATFYSASLGTPILLAAAPQDAVHPESPIAALLAVAPRLRADADPVAQIEKAIVGHDPRTLESITELTTSRVGESAGLLRALCYRLLNLPQPDNPARPATLSLPETAIPQPRSMLVRAELTESPGVATITRYPGSALTTQLTNAHLVVDTDEQDAGLLDLADILVHRRPGDAEHWMNVTLSALPGCLLAMAPTGNGDWLIGTRDGTAVQLTDVTGEPALHASLIHAWHDAGRDLRDLPTSLRVHAGGAPASARVVLIRNRHA